MIYRSFSKRQLLAMTWWNRPDLRRFDAIICDGAVRSGKTVCMVVGFFLWSMASFNGNVFALCGKTVASLRRNVVIHLQQWLGGVLDITEHRSDNRLEVRSPDGRKNTYYLFGGQDESSYMLIQGITLAGALLDEAVLMPRSFVEQTCARCSEMGAKLWFNCNPASPEHWFYKEWLEKCREKNALHLHFTMGDNPALPPEVRARYERMYTGHFYRRYVLGQWCGAEGLVYDFDPKRHVTEKLPQSGRYYISVDYGTQNPFSAGLWCVTGDKAYRLREYYYNGREAGRMRTDQEYYEALEDLAGDLPVEQVVIDPSAASFIAVVRKAGRFRVRRANNEVLPGIQMVARLLQTGRLQIGADCKAAIREFSLYCWQSTGERDQPVKENDHAMDDIRYFCMSVLRRTQ
ncbi:MAG: PBSX family phage terminase large subunit [Oscillospiraceae bacterium]|nr:PBSX family phage terminase large subunit [Oscillospiraceae bacterium]